MKDDYVGTEDSACSVDVFNSEVRATDLGWAEECKVAGYWKDRADHELSFATIIGRSFISWLFLCIIASVIASVIASIIAVIGDLVDGVIHRVGNRVGCASTCCSDHSHR